MARYKVIRVVTESHVVPWHLSNTLKRISKDFDVLVVGKNVSFNSIDYPDIKFVNININRKVSIISDISVIIELCKIFKDQKPDIIHSIMPKAGLLCAIAGYIARVPVRLHTFTGQIWATKSGFSKIFYCYIDKLINVLNTVCLTDSESQSAFLLKNKIAYNFNPLPVLSKGSLSGVDVNRFDMKKLSIPADHLRHQLGIEKKNFVFSYVARKTLDKGAFDMLKAFSKLKLISEHARLLFIGPDEEGLIAELKISQPDLFYHVIDIGHVKNHELYLAITDVLCLPSYREGFGTIIIDAASMSVPAIGSNIPGLVDAIADMETGILFDAGKIDDFVQIMSLLVADPMICKIMGKKAKERVEKYFTADKHYDALKEFYYKKIKDLTL